MVDTDRPQGVYKFAKFALMGGGFMGSAEGVSFAISVEAVLGDDDRLNLPGDEESVAAAIDPESFGGPGVVSDYDAAMLEADLMSAQNPEDKPDLHSD